MPSPEMETTQAQLRAGQFNALDDQHARYLEAYLEDRACEPHLWVLSEWIERLHDVEPLDRWVAERPKSWAARSVRAAYWRNEVRNRIAAPGGGEVTAREALVLASRDVEAAVQLEYRSYLAYGHAIEALGALGDRDAVVAMLNRVLGRDPANYGTRRRALQALWPREGEDAERLHAIARDAQAEARRAPRLIYLLGYASAAQAEVDERAGRRAEAVANFRRAVGYGYHHGWHNSLVSRLYWARDWSGAAEAIEFWLSDVPDDATAMSWQGLTLFRLDQPDAALQRLDQSVSLLPDNVWIRNNRGMVRDWTKNYEGALEDWHHSLGFEPENLTAVAGVASTLGTLGRYEEAIPYIEKWITLNPNWPNAWFHLGRALQALGDPRGAEILAAYIESAQSIPREEWYVNRARTLLAEPPLPQDPAELPGLARLSGTQNP
ncbi:MAG: tetratricopeptide repeat protein [Myxococcota bacterium]